MPKHLERLDLGRVISGELRLSGGTTKLEESWSSKAYAEGEKKVSNSGVHHFDALTAGTINLILKNIKESITSTIIEQNSFQVMSSEIKTQVLGNSTPEADLEAVKNSSDYQTAFKALQEMTAKYRQALKDVEAKVNALDREEQGLKRMEADLRAEKKAWEEDRKEAAIALQRLKHSGGTGGRSIRVIGEEMDLEDEEDE
jgi:predicted RNase H-like nuclease (RuvC/YqgF family)